jgi:phage-related minor tail protein
MANNIKGITIQIGGDTTGLDKALKGVNGQAREAQNELKEVNKALKLDPTNVELLEQKQRALASAVEATTKKLETLKDAQKQAADQLARGDIGQQQYDALSREIVKTEAELQKAKDAQDKFNISAEQASAKLSAVGDKAQMVADKTKALSAAAAGLVVAIGGAAVKSAAWADDLNTLSKQTGLTTEDLQKMQYASELVDVSVDDIAGSMSKMRRAMATDGKQDVFAQLGVSVRDGTGALRDSSTVFYEVLDRLGKVGNETERDTLAMEIFGRSADQLAGIIDDGGASLKALGEEAENLGLILDQDTLDAMNRVNDQIDRLKAQAQGQFAKAGAAALEALTPAIEGIVNALSKVLEFIGNLNPEVIKVVTIIAAIVAAISPVAAIIAKIAGLLATLAPLLPVIGTALAALASPVTVLIAGIAALVLILVDLVKTIRENWDKIKQKVTDAKDYVVGIFEKIRDAVKEKINAVIDFVNKGIEAINKLIAKINDSALGKFFGINIGSVGTLPALAGGGSLASGSALVGENGPELLSMSNGRANVQPLQTTTNTYNTINQTSRQPVQVILDVNGMQLARALYDPLKQVSAQRGPSFVK